MSILQYQLRTNNVEVLTQFDAELPKVMGDPHQLQQVFINILNNARQAIEACRPRRAHPHHNRSSQRHVVCGLPG